MRGYAKIEAWKLADDLTVAVYERTRPFLGGDLRFNRSIAPRILFSSSKHRRWGVAREQEGLSPFSIATIASLIVISLMHWSSRQLSVVS
jgi:hypothetical protein